MPDTTNGIVVTATQDTTWAAAYGGATTFSETIPVNRTPVRTRLTLQGDQAVLDWTGGVPPFAVHCIPLLAPDMAGWSEVAVDATPPLAFPGQSPSAFYRIVGR